MEILKSVGSRLLGGKGRGRGRGGVAFLPDRVRSVGAWLESLEGRMLLAAVSWDGGGDGVNWTSAKNWSNNVVPGANDDVTIGAIYSVKVSSGLTINGSLSLAGGLLFAGGNQSISGFGAVVMSGGYVVLGSPGPATTLTVGSSMTITGDGDLGYGSLAGSKVVNNGTILTSSSGKSLVINSAISVTNNGVLGSSGSGTLLVAGAVTNAGVISGASTSTVQITSVVNNGLTGTVSMGGSSVLEVDGTVIGGTIAALGKGTNGFTGDGTFDGVVLSGAVGVSGASTIHIKNGLTLSGELKVSSGSHLSFWGGNQSILGTGTITAGDTMYLGYSSGATNLTVGAGITLNGQGSWGYATYSGNYLYNNGTIMADVSGKTLELKSGITVTNNGVMTATNGATLLLAGGVMNEAQILGTGNSKVKVTDYTINGAKGLISISDTAVLDSAGVIEGGVIDFQTNGTANLTGGGTLDGVTISGEALVVTGNVPKIRHGLNLKGNLITSPDITFWGGAQTISGEGVLTVVDRISLGHGGTATELTVGEGVVFGGSGYFYHLTANGNKLINNGTIQASVVGKQLGIMPGLEATNNGVMEAINGGDLLLYVNISNTKEIRAEDKSTVTLPGTLTNGINGTLATGGTGALYVDFSGTVIGGTIVRRTDDQVHLKSPGRLDGVTINDPVTVTGTHGATIKNNLTLNSTLTLESGSPLRFWGGEQAVTGTGTIRMNERISLGYSGDSNKVTLGAGVTLAGEGAIDGGTGDELINNGTIVADVPYHSIAIFLNNGLKVTNNGVMRATGSGFLNVNQVFTNNGILEHQTGGVFTIAAGIRVPTTTAAVSAAAAQVGKFVTFTAYVSPALGTPTGSVDFYDGATLLGSAVLSGGVASFTTSGLAAKQYQVTAAYSGDGTFINNRSHPTGLTVTNAIQVTGTETISSPRTSAVGSWDVTFNELIDVASFNWQSVTLTRNSGANLITAGTGVTIALVSGKTYRISGLSALTTSPGSYTLRLVTGGVKDMYGFATTGSNSRTWTTNQPTFVSISSYAAPRTAPVLQPAIRLSEMVDLATFTLADITLTRNGGANLATAGSGIGVWMSAADLTLYTITLPSSLVGAVGNYSLTVNGAGVLNPTGVSFAGSKSTTWTIIAGVPTAPVLDAGSEGKPGSGYTQYTTPTVKGTGSAGSTVEIYEGAVLKGSGVVGNDGKYSIALSALAVGVHQLKARATDSLGTVTAYTAETAITVETASPTIVSMSVYGTPRTVPVGSTGIRFSSVMDLTTFTAADLTLTRNGAAVSTAGITVAASGTDAKLYTIVIPPGLNTADGVYVLSVTGGGIKNLAGKVVGNNFSTTWTVLPQILNMSQYSAPRTSPVTVPGIRFSNPITLATFTWADITLKRNGGANLATSAITIVQSASDASLYTIVIPSALTSTAGTYVLTVTGAGITSPNGYTVSNTMSTTWVQL
jgi:fibronectin-binding autotransporter adhesin